MPACLLAFAAGCVMHETYGDRAARPGELAVVQGYWHYRVLYDEELHVAAVDGRREGGRSGWPYAYSVSLPPGTHWLRVAILRNSSEIASCGFEWTFEARHRYAVQRIRHDQFLLAHPTSDRFAASLAIEVTAPGEPARNLRVPAVCGQHAICRQDGDCAAERSCRFDPALGFGSCEARDP